MKKFKFKLEPVLELRKNREEQVQLELASVLKRLDFALQDYNGILQHRDEISIKLENLKVCPGGIEDLILYQNYIESVDRRLSMKLILIQEIRGEVDEVRRRLLNAARDRKAIEKLKEKQKKIHGNMVRRLEDKFLDDIGTVRCARREMGNGKWDAKDGLRTQISGFSTQRSRSPQRITGEKTLISPK